MLSPISFSSDEDQFSIEENRARGEALSEIFSIPFCFLSRIPFDSFQRIFIGMDEPMEMCDIEVENVERKPVTTTVQVTRRLLSNPSRVSRKANLEHVPLEKPALKMQTSVSGETESSDKKLPQRSNFLSGKPTLKKPLSREEVNKIGLKYLRRQH